MKKLISLFAIYCCLAMACNKDKDNPQNECPKPAEKVLETRVNQDNAFAFDLLKQTIQFSGESNVIVSPISVSLALGMTWNGANGNTKTEMETALKMNGLSDEEINEYYRYMQTTLPSLDPDSKLNIANSIWYKTGFSVYSDFLNRNSTYFNSEIRELNFSQPNAVDIINNWCAQKTNNLIPNVLQSIPSDAVMYLINAIYFKGVWKTKFDKNNTSEYNFTTEKGQQTKVNMMTVRNDFPYTEDTYAQYLDMPYGNESFSMTLVLPNEGKTIDGLLNYMTLEKWNQCLGQLKTQEVFAGIPRFKSKAQYGLIDILTEMGMKKAFSPMDADFSKLSSDKVYISKVLHNTYIEVTEEGTEAAAVTTIGVTATSVKPNNTLIANKPFLFVIREKSTGIILFIGKMGEIEKY